MEKDKILKNNLENSNTDTKMDKKKSDSLHNNPDAGVSANNTTDTDPSKSSVSSGSNSDNNSIGLDLAVLNKLSQTTKMAMNAISYLSSKICDREIKKEIIAIYSQYSNILSQINQHFERYGEIPDGTSLHTKMMTYCGIRANLVKDSSTSHVAEIMIQGIIMGVIECEKIINRDLDLSKSTNMLLHEFSKFQKESIEKLSKYL